jgi:hypothetical protein
MHTTFAVSWMRSCLPDSIDETGGRRDVAIDR